MIVLRIPGPAKYAAHLQTLLQQYLEVRAAQYIQLLQEQEYHGQNLGYQAQYGAPPAAEAYHTIQYPVPNEVEPQQQHYSAPLIQQEYGAPQQESYDNGDQDSYQPQTQHHGSYQPQIQQHQHEHSEVEQHEEEHSAGIIPETNPHIQLVYQTEDAGHDPYSGEFRPSAVDHTQNQHEVPHVAHQQPTLVYGPPIPSHHHHQQHHEEESHHSHDHLLTTENFPSDQHTQVIFKPTTPHSYHHSSHAAPQVQVQTYRAPLVYHKLEQFYGADPEYNAEADYGSHSDIGPVVSETNFVTITPRPVGPYNYHAHPHAASNHYDHDYSTAASAVKVRSSKRQTQITDERYKKFTNLMNRLKERMTSTKTSAGSAAAA